LAVNYADNSVSYLDLLSRRVVANIPVCTGPLGVDIHPDRRYAYVACWDAGEVDVLDLEERRVVAHLWQIGSEFYSIQFRPDGGVAYVVDARQREVLVLATSDVTNPRPVNRIALPGARAPRNLDFTFSGDRAFISDSEAGQIWVIDSIAHRVETVWHTGGRCSVGVRASPLGQFVYVADRCLATVFHIERETGEVTPIPLPGAPGAWHIAFSFDERYAFVTETEPRENRSSGRVAVIDTRLKQRVRTIDIGGHPGAIEVFTRPDPADPEKEWLYLAIADPSRSTIFVALESPTGGETIVLPPVSTPSSGKPGKTTRISKPSCKRPPTRPRPRDGNGNGDGDGHDDCEDRPKQPQAFQCCERDIRVDPDQPIRWIGNSSLFFVEFDPDSPWLTIYITFFIPLEWWCIPREDFSGDCVPSFSGEILEAPGPGSRLVRQQLDTGFGFRWCLIPHSSRGVIPVTWSATYRRPDPLEGRLRIRLRIPARKMLDGVPFDRVLSATIRVGIPSGSPFDLDVTDVRWEPSPP